MVAWICAGFDRFKLFQNECCPHEPLRLSRFTPWSSRAFTKVKRVGPGLSGSSTLSMSVFTKAIRHGCPPRFVCTAPLKGHGTVNEKRLVAGKLESCAKLT